MNVLIVYAHPEPTSFTAAMKDAALDALREAGHTVDISDLYAEQFDPVAGRHDFQSVANAARFHYQTEQDHAAKTNSFAPDLAEEQRRLLNADLMLFVFPVWWGGLPAILKGWFDRVFAYGIAYADGKRFDQGYFRGRRGLLCMTTGGTQERYSATGVYGDIHIVLHSVQRGILEYIGLDVAEPFVAYAAPRVDDATRRGYLNALAARVVSLANDPDWQARLADIKSNEKPMRDDIVAQAWTRSV